MATFYKTIMKVGDNGKSVTTYGGEVEADEQPADTFESLELYDLYVDYHTTKEKALKFMRDANE